MNNNQEQAGKTCTLFVEAAWCVGHKKYATYWKVLLGSWSLQNSARTQVYFGCSENRGVTVFRK